MAEQREYQDHTPKSWVAEAMQWPEERLRAAASACKLVEDMYGTNVDDIGDVLLTMDSLLTLSYSGCPMPDDASFWISLPIGDLVRTARMQNTWITMALNGHAVAAARLYESSKKK